MGGKTPGLDGRCHVLADRDDQAMTATCAICGPVRTVPNGGPNKVACSVKEAARTRVRRRRRNLRKFDISAEDWDALLAKQQGVCAICLLPERVERDNNVRLLCVDHDHLTGAIRGLLCSSCNIAIGLLRDEPKYLRAAANYLEDARGES